jgi:hypothetical protein
MRKKTNAWYKEGRKVVRARGADLTRPARGRAQAGGRHSGTAYAGTPSPRKPGPPGTLSIAVVCGYRWFILYNKPLSPK